MTRRCPKCGCSLERLPEESGAAEQIASDADIDGVVSGIALIAEFARRLWPMVAPQLLVFTLQESGVSLI